jgi:pimeloyl-ACP methyl ester carboxylesterase
MSEQPSEHVRLPVAGGYVAGELSAGPSSEGWAVLWVHGFGAHRGGEKALAVRTACARRGWTFAAFDFRGHGGSSGTMLELLGTGLLADLDAVWRFLSGRGVRRLGLVGSSMGGWASAWFARQTPEAVAGCVLLAPAFQFMHRRWATMGDAEREAWRTTGRHTVRNEWLNVEVSYALAEERDRFPPGRLAADWATPMLVFHGLRDNVVPATESISFVDLTTYPDIELRLFKDGDHRLTAFKEEIAEAACRFFERVR